MEKESFPIPRHLSRYLCLSSGGFLVCLSHFGTSGNFSLKIKYFPIDFQSDTQTSLMLLFHLTDNSIAAMVGHCYQRTRIHLFSQLRA